MELDTLLDDTWIRDFEETYNIYQDFYKTDLYYINLTFIYINRNNEIDKIKNEPFILNKPNVISSEDHLEILKKNLIDDNKRYSLLSILKYNINLEPEEIKRFIKDGENNQTFLSLIKNINTITFEKSIHMFHDLNDLIFIFYEKSNELKQYNPNSSSKKNCLNSFQKKNKKTLRKRYKD